MSIPPITQYPMPRDAEIPGNAVSWSIDPQRAVLLIHDMQKYFVAPFPDGESPTVDLLRNIARLRSCCTRLGVPVVYTAQPGGMTDEQRGLLRDFWGPGMATDPADRAVVDELAPTSSDRVFVKWRYSAFHRTGLLDYVRAERRDQIIVSGVYAHVGCLMTACDAYTHDIQCFLAADAVADFSLEYHLLALRYAAERCASVLTTDMLVAVLRGVASAPAF